MAHNDMQQQIELNASTEQEIDTDEKYNNHDGYGNNKQQFIEKGDRILVRTGDYQENATFPTDLYGTVTEIDSNNSTFTVDYDKVYNRPQDTNKSLTDKDTIKLVKCLLNVEWELEDCSKHQSFTINGWVDIYWKWDQNATGMHGILKGFPQTVDTKIKQDYQLYDSWNEENNFLIRDIRKTRLGYYLPIDPNRIFTITSIKSVKHITPPIFDYNKKTEIAHVNYHIHAELNEYFELNEFPFDKQFLNVKLRWNCLHYHIINFGNNNNTFFKDPWWNLERRWKALHLTLSDEIRHDWALYTPWIDFRVRKKNKQKHPARFALIRLRVDRNPLSFCINVLIPFFILVCCSFSVFAISRTSIEARLSVSVTILLTFTAFQDAVEDKLPEGADILKVNKYIFWGYILQALLLLLFCIVYAVDYSDYCDDETVEYCEIFFGAILALFWVGNSMNYWIIKLIFSPWWHVKKRRKLGTLTEFWKTIEQKETAFWINRANDETNKWVNTAVINNIFTFDGKKLTFVAI
eukprot:331171_1